MTEAPRAVVGAFIMNAKGELLLGRSPKWGGKWCVPGGGIEWGETALKAAEREAKEEVGLGIRAQKVFGCGEAVFSKEFHKKAHIVYFDVLCRVKAKSALPVVDGKEITETRWILPKKALRMNLVSFDRKSIKALLRLRGR